MDKINIAADRDFDKALAEWLKGSQKIVDDSYGKKFNTFEQAVLSVMKGKRYVRIVRSLYGVDADPKRDKPHSQSAFAFIDTTNGDVLKPAGWKAPAKKSRGNLYDESGGLGMMGPYGPAYLR